MCAYIADSRMVMRFFYILNSIQNQTVFCYLSPILCCALFVHYFCIGNYSLHTDRFAFIFCREYLSRKTGKNSWYLKKKLSKSCQNSVYRSNLSCQKLSLISICRTRLLSLDKVISFITEHSAFIGFLHTHRPFQTSPIYPCCYWKGNELWIEDLPVHMELSAHDPS